MSGDNGPSRRARPGHSRSAKVLAYVSALISTGAAVINIATSLRWDTTLLALLTTAAIAGITTLATVWYIVRRRD